MDSWSHYVNPMYLRQNFVNLVDVRMRMDQLELQQQSTTAVLQDINKVQSSQPWRFDVVSPVEYVVNHYATTDCEVLFC